ncbi:uncharacterized protein MKK02DRAFT_39654 [Dioszegia hungarica]|uniref:Uncharacterized protein n=1 Tax=Dioszegia hungarica TaxID=4972 RepID=A0AA38HHK7_9TREE|nr:uncharacterized protein MKK02DRAFT_39654 [Dioszegia hungarica]KAI9639354.1 hypothetical protein MKK02DRAFT_39654 [Dioszegia hungarica]
MSCATYDRLHTSSQMGKTVFRIWAQAGESPLISHSDPSRGGFFSPNSFANNLTKVEFDVKCRDLDLAPDPENDTWTSDSILDHVRGPGDWLFHDRKKTRSRAPHERDDTPSDTAPATPKTNRPYESPWIVTHGDLDYTIHRVVRLLARDYNARIHMSVIEPRVINGHHFERSTKSTDHLPILKARAPWGGAERKLLNEAQLFAHSSGEVLFYGRIFGHSVKEDFIWTTQTFPFDLPDWFWRNSTLDGPWIDRLNWIPYLTSYRQAKRRMDEKRQKEEESREEPIISWRKAVVIR